MNQRLQLTGIGLRPPHYAEFIEKKPGIAWIEVHSENYFGDGGNHLNILEKVRADYPVSLHGVSLSIGSADELNWRYLKQLKDLISRIDPCLVSDHLCWSSIDGQYLHDLLPLPYTEEVIEHVVGRIQKVQEYLKRPLLIENITRYVNYQTSSMPEYEFINEIATRAGCGILLDVSNIYVNSLNLNVDPLECISAISSNVVQEIHLGGFASAERNGKEVYIDSHNQPIVPAVWELYRETVKRLGYKPTIIEWDDQLPSLDSLCLEANRAEKIVRETYVAAKRTA